MATNQLSYVNNARPYHILFSLAAIIKSVLVVDHTSSITPDHLYLNQPGTLRSTVDEDTSRGTTANFGLKAESRVRLQGTSPSRIVSDPGVNGVGDHEILMYLVELFAVAQWIRYVRARTR